MRHGTPLAALLLVLSTPIALAQGQTLGLQLSPTLTDAFAGQTLDYTAMVTNLTNGSIVLNADALVLDNGLNATRIGGIVNDVPLSIPANQTDTLDAFELQISPSTPPGDYLNDYTVYDINNNTSNTIPFTVDIVTGVPEPGSIGLLVATGLSLPALAYRRRSR